MEAKMPRVRDPFNYDTDVVSFQTGLDCSEDPSLAQQHARDETDINFLVAKFGIGEVAMEPRPYEEVVFDTPMDFQEMMNATIAARQQFMELPAKLRERFKNDPGEFLSFVENEENRPEAEFLGILVPKPTPEPAKAPEAVSVPPVAPPGAD